MLKVKRPMATSLNGRAAAIQSAADSAERGATGTGTCRAIKDGVDGLANVSARLLTRETSVGSGERARRAIGRIRAIVVRIAAAAAVGRSGGKHRKSCQQGVLAEKARNHSAAVTTHGPRGSSIHARTVAQYVPALAARLDHGTRASEAPRTSEPWQRRTGSRPSNPARAGKVEARRARS